MTATGTTTFGVTGAYMQSVLRFNSTIGASSLNANNVQAATVLTASSLTSTDGATIVLSGAKTYTITAAPLTITASNQSTTYGTSLALGTSAFTTSGLVTAYGDTISSVTLKQNSVTTVPNTTNAGTYSGAVNGIVASAAVAGSGTLLSNYSITYATGTLTVNQATVSISAAKTYDNTTSH